VERLQGESKALQRTIRGLQEQLAVHEAAALVARGERVGDSVIVVEALEGWDAVGLKALASAAAAAEPHAVVALFSTTSPAVVVVARGKNTSVDAAAVLKSLVAKYGGKGGGKADFAQGGGLVGSSAQLVTAAKDLFGRHS
jgi:alanyl-tRNA synthetase